MITAMPRIAIAVHDFPATVATFREAFGMPVIDLSETSVDSLGAQLAMCVPEGGSNIELMSPADPSSPLSQSLQKFLDRRGEGLFALMLEAPDPDGEAEELSGRGLNVLPLMAGAGGRDVHPKSTHGVLIRVYPNRSFSQRSNDEPREPAVSGIDRVLIAVKDVAEAIEAYGRGLGLEVTEPAVDEERGVTFATCTPPSGGKIELVAPFDSEKPFASKVARFLEERREGMFALVLQAHDPRAAAESLRGRDVVVQDGETLEASVFGATVFVEPRA